MENYVLDIDCKMKWQSDHVHIFFAGCKVMYSTVIACSAFGMHIYSCLGLALLIRTDYYYIGKSTC